MNRVVKRQQGFTLIELMLAMSFIAVLLIAIAMTVIQIGGIYNKGLTVKELNQTSRDITEDLRRTISMSGQFDPSTDYREVVQSGQRIGGRICLGTVSYVWNYAGAIESDNARLIRYPTGTRTGPIGLVKTPDASRAYCSLDPSSGQLAVPNLLSGDVDESRELLSAGDRGLSLYNLRPSTSSTAMDRATHQRLFVVRFTIGTGDTSLLNTGASPITCKTPSEIGPDLNYCTVQDFSIVVRAGTGF